MTFEPRGQIRGGGGSRVVVVGFVLVLAVLVGGAFLGYSRTEQLAEYRRSVFRTHETIDGLEMLLSHLKDAETGQRGYLLVGEGKYLEPYEQAWGKCGRMRGNWSR